MNRRASRRALERLLDQRNQHPERLAAIDASIRETFEQSLAIMVLDMCGFSRLTVKHGITHYLALIRRMQLVVLPLVRKHGGRVVKTEADNVFAVFESARAALAAAEAIQHDLEQANAVLPADWDIHVSIGIGFGPVLVIGEEDLYGSQMNLASKLGEDLATAGQILITAEAYAELPRLRARFTAKKTRISGMALPYYELAKRAGKGRAKRTAGRP